MTPVAAPRPVWTRYVAIGDSFTEGMSDPDPARPDAYVGWADRLAHHLDAIAEAEHLPFGYANLAVRGRKLHDVVGPQLEAALTMTPDLVSMVGGGNDLLRPSVDLDGLASRLEDAVVRIRQAGADVLLATPTDTRDAGLVQGAARPARGAHREHLHASPSGTAATSSTSGAWPRCATGGCGPTTASTSRARGTAGSPSPRSPPWATTPTSPTGRRRCPRPTRRPAATSLRGHAEWARTHARPWVQRRLRGESSGDAVVAKRPSLQHFRDPEGEPRHQALPDA